MYALVTSQSFTALCHTQCGFVQSTKRIYSSLPKFLDIKYLMSSVFFYHEAWKLFNAVMDFKHQFQMSYFILYKAAIPYISFVCKVELEFPCLSSECCLLCETMLSCNCYLEISLRLGTHLPKMINRKTKN